MNIKQGLTFDDLLLRPQLSSISPSDVNTETRLTKKISLKIPLLSAAMDTVTTEKVAIILAQLGGLGVIHRNCTIEQEVAMVKKVKEKKLLVGAACGPLDEKRALALDKAGADAIFFDCAHAHKPDIKQNALKIKKQIKAELIIGNIATEEAAKYLLNCADALKIGVGPGSICTTRIIAGTGVPQATAIEEVVKIAKKKNIPVIADGGIKYSGDAVKALAIGAETIMIGSLIAGSKETPGEIVTIDGKKYKRYRGMGSLGAMQVGKSSDRYFQNKTKKYVPEGVEALTEYKGELNEVIYQLIGGLKSGMGYIGAKKITEMPDKANFIQITNAGYKESHPHSITLEKQSPNYSAKY